MVGHAGAVLLRSCAHRVGLTSALSKVLPRRDRPGWWDRGTVLVSLAVAIVRGAKSMSDIGDAIAQLPLPFRRKILIRVDGAGATRDLWNTLKSKAAIDQLTLCPQFAPTVSAHRPMGSLRDLRP